MGSRLNGTVARQLRVLFESGRTGDLDDAQLLDRFTSGPAEARDLAFSTLVERHGPSVHRICRSVIGDEHAAHDAFQATFLVLATRSDRLRVNGSLGPWLRKVAHQVASRARRSAARRRKHELRFVAGPIGRDRDSPPATAARSELAEIIRGEVDRLADRDRAVIALCDLDGHSLDLAATMLGWPVGTVKSRLSRARARLKGRLERRGLAPSMVPLIGVSGRVVAPALPTGLADATVRMASQVAAGGLAGVVPASVAVLSEGAIRMMFWSTLKFGAAGLMASGVMVSGLSGLVTFETGEPGDDATAVVVRQSESDRQSVLLDDVGREIARLDLQLLAEDVEAARNQLADALRGELDAERTGAGIAEARSIVAEARTAYLDAARAVRDQRRSLDATAPAPVAPTRILDGEQTISDVGTPRVALGTIDVDAVFKQAKKVTAASAAIRDLAAAQQAELNELVSEREALRRRMDEPGLDPLEMDSMEIQISELQTRLDAEREQAQREFAQREADVLASIYGEMMEVVADVARTRGFTHVVKVNSESVSANSSPTSVIEALKRSVLYADPRTDITAEVLRELDRRFLETGDNGLGHQSSR